MIPRTTSGRWLAGATVAVVIMVALSIAIALLADRSSPDLLPEGSPQRAVQDYILASQEGDIETAYSLLSANVRQECKRDDFSPDSRFMLSNDYTVRLKSARETGNSAIVVIEFTELNVSDNMPLFGAQSHSFDTTYRLTRESGEWRLREDPWPKWACLDLAS